MEDFIHERIAELQQKIHDQDPTMPSALTVIHKQLQSYPELAHILSDEEIGTIVSGIMARTQETIATTPKKTSLKALVNSLSLDDF